MPLLVDEYEINSKLNLGELILQSSSRKAKIWECFNLVVDSKTKEETGYIQCKKCKKNMIYAGEKGSKGRIYSHVCMKAISNKASVSKSKVCPVPKLKVSPGAPKKVGTIFPWIRATGVKIKKEITTKTEEDILLACIKFCAKDVRPIETLEGRGFLELAQKLISLGALHGKTSATKIIRPKSISNSLTRNANSSRNIICSKINEVMRNSFCSATADMWTDYKKISYVSVTLHYINEDWTLANKVLFTFRFHEEQNSYENIRYKIKERFSKIGIDDFEKKLVQKPTFITDQEPNIVKAFQNYCKLNCYSYIINTILIQTFDEDYLEKNAQEIQRIILQSKALVIYLKENESEIKLKHAFHLHEIEARWDSKFEMLKSILDQYHDIEDFVKKKKLIYLENISKDGLEELVNFLEPFKTAIDALEYENSPTIQLVLLYRLKLCKHLKASKEDSINLKDLKERAKKYLEEEYHIFPIHKISLFLCPNFRRLRMLNDIEREEVFESVYQQINFDSSNTTEVPGEEPEKACPAPKRLKTSEFQEWEDVPLDDVKPSDKGRTSNGSIGSAIPSTSKSSSLDSAVDTTQFTSRSSMSNEATTSRANVSDEANTNRPVLSNEATTSRLGLSDEAKARRANVANEANTSRATVSGEANASRANVANEANTSRAIVSHAANTSRATVSHAANTSRATVSHAANTSRATVSHAANTSRSTVSHAANTNRATVSHAANTNRATVSHAANTSRATVSHAANTRELQCHMQQTQEELQCHMQQTISLQVSHAAYSVT
ncbi:Transposable element Hobo transposase [Armadillidium vulgare]|nr:Transposable element Hobo transposase [Armadillidium vulgare]